MNWDAIGALSELAGALGVIASLVYLAIQIRQNTRSAREASREAVARDLQQFRALIAQDPEVARIYREGLRDVASLSEDDRWRFGALMQTVFTVAEAQHRKRRSGLFQHELDDILYTAGRPGAREWWRMGKRFYSLEFQRFVDDALDRSDDQG